MLQAVVGASRSNSGLGEEKKRLWITAVPQTGHEGLSPDFSRKEAQENAKRKMDWDSAFAPIFRLFEAENLPLRISSVVLFHPRNHETHETSLNRRSRLKIGTPHFQNHSQTVTTGVSRKEAQENAKRKMDWDSPFAPIFRLFAAENLPLRISSVVLFLRFFRF